MLAAAETREGSFKALVLLSLLLVVIELARVGEHALDARRRRRAAEVWQISGYLGIWSYLPATPSILPYPDSSRPLSYPTRIALGSLSSLPQIAFWASDPRLTVFHFSVGERTDRGVRPDRARWSL